MSEEGLYCVILKSEFEGIHQENSHTGIYSRTLAAIPGLENDFDVGLISMIFLFIQNIGRRWHFGLRFKS